MNSPVSKNHFPEMVSRSNKRLTWLLRVIFVLFVLLPIAFLLYGAPVLLYSGKRFEDEESLLFLVTCYMVSIAVSSLFIYHIKKTKRKAVKRIRVNRTGVHHDKVNDTTDSVLYEQLEKAPLPHKHDVFEETGDTHMGTEHHFVVSTIYLVAFRDGYKIRLLFGNTDVFHTSLTVNQKFLQKHFVQEVKLFRPDLTISPYVLRK